MSGPRSIGQRAARLTSRNGRGCRYLHETPAQPANPLPIVATGPPPAPPRPSVTEAGERAERRRRQADLLKLASERATKKSMAASSTRPLDALRQRFWKDVSVQRTPEGLHTVHLDTRAVRSPHVKSPLQLPATKPHLATAIALEWDGLTSAQQALKTHLIPLTSLAARAQDLAQQDAADAAAGKEMGSGHGGDARRDIVRLLLRYLDTDTLLCWAPPPASAPSTTAAEAAVTAAAAAAAVAPSASGERGGGLGPAQAAKATAAILEQQGEAPSEATSTTTQSPPETLRERQERTAAPIVAYLTTFVWPGVELVPALGEASIVPAPQPEATRAIVRGWLAGLGAWELAGLERAALATKSLCVAARLVAEWSENLRVPASPTSELSREAGAQRFGVDEAEYACTVEVRWQTGQWGEVEDTHDVEREDLRRQLGSAVLLVSGTQHAD